MEREAYREQPEELRLRLLVYLMARVSGKNSRPRLARLQALDGVLMSGETNRQTFQGSVFDADASVIRVWKEPGRERRAFSRVLLDPAHGMAATFTGSPLVLLARVMPPCVWGR